jgi:hypothetical protein
MPWNEPLKNCAPHSLLEGTRYTALSACALERKDVVTLAFHEFFERRQYLPVEE